MTDFVLRPKAPCAAAARYAQLVYCGRQRVAPAGFAALPGGDGVVLVGAAGGRLSCAAGAARYVLTAGQALLLPEDSPLLAEVESEILYARLTGEAVLALLNETVRTGGPLFPNGYAVLSEVLAPHFRAAELGTPPDAAAVAAAAYALAVRLYGKSAAAQTAYPPLVHAALDILRTDFAYLYGMDDLAQRLHVTKEHLIRTFTAAVGMPPGKYLTHLRVEYAKQVLAGGETSMEAVAASAGFSGASYFGKVFRAETGLTPRQYAAAAPRAQKRTPDEIYL